MIFDSHGLRLLLVVAALAGWPGATTLLGQTAEDSAAPAASRGVKKKLPPPRLDSTISLEEALRHRRSVRDYRRGSLTLADVSQLLWAAQGKTSPDGGRTSPSAGALYPLEVYLVAGDVNDLPAGVYRYQPGRHRLLRVSEGDKRKELCNAALEQAAVREAAAVIVFTAVYERTTRKYGQRGVRYAHIEVGHAAQNVCLQAAALGLGTVTIGAFEDDKVKRILALPGGEQPLYLLPVGRIS